MDADEREICLFLKGWPGQFVALAEICRRAGPKKRYRKDPRWAVPILNRLVVKGVLESDATGHYRLKASPKKDKRKPQKFLAPEIRKILERSGKDFGGVVEIESTDESLEYLQSAKPPTEP
jgi:hypothetical protein